MGVKGKKEKKSGWPRRLPLPPKLNTAALTEEEIEVLKKKEEEISQRLREHFKLPVKKRVTLKDIRAYWNNGVIKRDGKEMTIEQTVYALQQKHRKQGNEIPLTQDELYVIIYKDKSIYQQQASPAEELQLKVKKLELEEKRLDMAALKHKYETVAYKNLMLKKEADELSRKLAETSTPDEFGLEMFQRMAPQYVIMAIQSKHPELNTTHCKLIIGSWVRRRL